MSEDRKKILEMLKSGKISVDEADELLGAMGETPAESPEKPSSLRIECCAEGKGKKEEINLRIPLGLLRSGVKLASLIPDEVTQKVDSKLKAKGIAIKFGDLDKGSIDELIKQLCDCKIDVNTDKETVRVYCE